MVHLSVCMIVKNEEKVLARCLDSLGDLADELVIVDTGSKDKTKAIAKKYTDKIFDFIWKDDFSAARNFAFDQATMEYVMWLDADDFIPKETRVAIKIWKQGFVKGADGAPNEKKIEKVIEKMNKGTDAKKGEEADEKLKEKPDVVMLKYATGFDEKGKVTFSYYRERILRREKGYRFAGRVHEAIALLGKIEYMDYVIEHRSIKTEYGTRNLDIYEKMKENGELLSPRDVFYYARELFYHGKNVEAVENIRKFLQMKDTFVENRVDACKIAAYAEYQMGGEDTALEFLMRGLKYQVPGAELCCDIGKHFFDRAQWKQAIFWYENAVRAVPEEESGRFVNWDCYGYLPYIQLSVCYYKIGQMEKAVKYHKLAGEKRPYGEVFFRNQAYFERR